MTNRKDELAKRNFFDELIELRDKQRNRLRNGMLIIKGKDIPVESNLHGLMQWYIHPNMNDVAINSEIIYVQHIPPGSKSGRQHHPGGKIFFFWKGKGYTVMEGVKYSWVAGELLQLPLRPDGVTYQHFNDSDEEEARIIAVEANYVDSLGVDKGSKFEQLENSPDYKK